MRRTIHCVNCKTCTRNLSVFIPYLCLFLVCRSSKYLHVLVHPGIKLHNKTIFFSSLIPALFLFCTHTTLRIHLFPKNRSAHSVRHDDVDIYCRCLLHACCMLCFYRCSRFRLPFIQSAAFLCLSRSGCIIANHYDEYLFVCFFFLYFFYISSSNISFILWCARIVIASYLIGSNGWIAGSMWRVYVHVKSTRRRTPVCVCLSEFMLFE